MKSWPRLRLPAIALLLAPCAGLPALAAAAAIAALPAGINSRATGAGQYLIDARGMALYTYAQDSRPGASACKGECAVAWPPLLAPADASVAGEWSVVPREDGTRQWAFRGKPLYRFAKDEVPGAALGDRVGKAWNLAFIPVALAPGTRLRATYLGRVLVDARGRTLYWSDKEKPAAGRAAQPRCADECLQLWEPLAAPRLANRVGDWAPVARPDGTMQWTYQSRPLYLMRDDLKPGEARGEGIDEQWRAAVLEPAPPLPAWLSVQSSDLGEVYANAQGFTLYTVAGSLDKIRQTTCNEACIAAFWRLVPAVAGTQGAGEWTTVASPDGKGRVWAYKGNPVYTHTRDRGPGRVAGDKWAAGVGGGGGGWIPIPRRRDLEE
jgi:predicted lipoprotein with Yx(FWY)xxD motif